MQIIIPVGFGSNPTLQTHPLHLGSTTQPHLRTPRAADALSSAAPIGLPSCCAPGCTSLHCPAAVPSHIAHASHAAQCRRPPRRPGQVQPRLPGAPCPMFYFPLVITCATAIRSHFLEAKKKTTQGLLENSLQQDKKLSLLLSEDMVKGVMMCS